MDSEHKKKGFPLVKWMKIVLPKSRGGWGIKNLNLFCKALAAKSLWRLVENLDTLWGRIMREKYCPNASIEEWFHQPTKTHKGGSLCWKAFVEAFPLVGNWVTWQVGDGRRIRIVQDPWVGSGDNFRLPITLFSQLKEKEISTLVDARSYTDRNQRATVWKTTQEMELAENDAPVWNSYINQLKTNFIHLDEEKNKLNWT